MSEGAAVRHREIAGGFTAAVIGAGDWDAPSPVPGWVARDVVRHLVEWLPALLASGSDVRLERGPSVDEDPVAAWQVHAASVQALLDDPATAGLMLVNPHIGELPVDRAVDDLYTTDVFLHTWDLARATGQDDRLDEATCAQLLAGMEPMDGVLRASGEYGPRFPVPFAADARSRLIGFIGRDPDWSPSSEALVTPGDDPRT